MLIVIDFNRGIDTAGHRDVFHLAIRALDAELLFYAANVFRCGLSF